MPSRITQSMMSNQLILNLNRNVKRMDDLQNQLSTGRRINKPSDDPVGISFAMRYRSELAANDQHQSNVDSAVSWLDYTDTMLGQVGDVMHRVRELTVQGSNGTNPKDALIAIKEEINQLSNQLVSIGNSQFNGKYVFNGQMTDQPPYVEGVLSDTDAGEIRMEIGAGINMAVNVPGNRIFGGATDPDNAFQVLQELQDALEIEDNEAVSALPGKLDSRIDTILKERSDIGAKINRIELAENRLKDINVNLQTLQTKTEDADIAAVITNLKLSENVYQSSLAVGSKIIRPSLIDYLR